jgi:hypothetical protein
MAKLQLKAGTTSKSVPIVVLDSTKTDGSGLASLAYNTGSLICYWWQPGVTAPAAITLATLSTITSAYSSGGFKEADATHTPGHYRLDIPNACLTGATDVVIELNGAANMAACRLEIELTATDNQDAVHGGMSALPNASPGAANGVFIAGVNAPTTVTTSFTTHLVGTVDTVTTLTTLPSIPANWLTAAGINAAALNGKGDWSTYAGGAVASVTGAVGSVTAGVTLAASQHVIVDSGTVTAVTNPVGIDWAQIANPTHANALTGTSISSSQVVATVGGSVTVGGYAAGQDPATYVLVTAGNKLATDSSGRIDVGKILGTASAGTAGYMAPDWGHVNAPTTAVGLTGTTVSSSQVVASVTAGVTVTTNNDKTGYSLTQSFPTNFSSLAIDTNGLVKLVGAPKKNTAMAGFQFYLAQSSDHYSPATGKSVSATRSLDGAAFAACANSVAEIGNGWYKIDLATADLNGISVALSFAASAADSALFNILTTP